MLRLHDIMTRELVTLSPEHTLRDAMTILTTRHVSGAPVIAGDQVVGVISLTDLAEFAASTPGVPTERPQGEEWETLNDDVDVDVDDEDEPTAAYFERLWDDAGADVAERFESTEGPEWSALEDHNVGEAMSRNVLSLTPGTRVDYAAAFMRDRGIHRVLVMDGDELLGVVSTKDIANAVADHRITSRVYTFGAPM